MTFDELFDEYKHLLDWINRRTAPNALEFYGETKEQWSHAKQAIFFMFEHLRGYVENGYPNLENCLSYGGIENYPPYKINDDYECPVVALLNYREETFPVYDDDAGQQNFIVVNGSEISVDGLGGSYDWYFEVDKVIDKIYD